MNKTMQKARKNNKGFTLVELIIVIAIIAILAAVLAPQYIKYIDRSRWSTDQSNATTLLNEVQVAVVACGSDDKSVNNETITFTSAGVSGPTAESNADLLAALNEADANWKSIKVTNKGTAAGSSVKHATYTIVITDSKVTGSWTA